MNMTLALALVAVGMGALHTLAFDHWVPFAALARAEHRSIRRTALVTAACGLGHVTVSVLLGLVALVVGLAVMQAFGEQLERVAGLLLISFGVVYGLWGLHRAMRDRIHAQMHGVLPEHQHGSGPGHHHHHNETAGRRTTWTLFLLFSADPCVAVIPMMFAAAPLGWASALIVVIAYETATIAMMVALTLPARMAASAVRGQWADRYGDALAGGIITAVGVFVTVLGI
jgi:nickel/cobalt exporter